MLALPCSRLHRKAFLCTSPLENWSPPLYTLHKLCSSQFSLAWSKTTVVGHKFWWMHAFPKSIAGFVQCLAQLDYLPRTCCKIGWWPRHEKVLRRPWMLNPHTPSRMHKPSRRPHPPLRLSTTHYVRVVADFSDCHQLWVFFIVILEFVCI